MLRLVYGSRRGLKRVLEEAPRPRLIVGCFMVGAAQEGDYVYYVLDPFDFDAWDLKPALSDVGSVVVEAQPFCLNTSTKAKLRIELLRLMGLTKAPILVLSPPRASGGEIRPAFTLRGWRTERV